MPPLFFLLSGVFIGFGMPKNPQKWHFLNWTQLGLSRGTPM
ncbi:hypothetical protein F383_31115 [Gossypium arboreum]|uniref:Uncharacterized protein n=1 Tax=Gossypium arboreum TaxID=29729 RepID=A0A0B0PDG1_GOSAR|nr:hypothetical protein F383_31115 [Gossypium arboreum]